MRWSQGACSVFFAFFFPRAPFSATREMQLCRFCVLSCLLLPIHTWFQNQARKAHQSPFVKRVFVATLPQGETRFQYQTFEMSHNRCQNISLSRPLDPPRNGRRRCSCRNSSTPAKTIVHCRGSAPQSHRKTLPPPPLFPDVLFLAEPQENCFQPHLALLPLWLRFHARWNRVVSVSTGIIHNSRSLLIAYDAVLCMQKIGTIVPIFLMTYRQS